jgi:hypothetical protein
MRCVSPASKVKKGRRDRERSDMGRIFQQAVPDEPRLRAALAVGSMERPTVG